MTGRSLEAFDEWKQKYYVPFDFRNLKIRTPHRGQDTLAHIVEFSVDGLVGRNDSYSQHLNRDVNVFFGPNGNGKTSLLKILHSAMAADGSILTNVPFKAAEVKIFSEQFKKTFTRTLKKDSIQHTTADKYIWSPTLVQQPILFQESSESWARYSLAASEIPNWKTKPQGPKKPVYWHHQYLPTSRLWISPVANASATEPVRTEEELDRRFQVTLESLWRGYIGDVLAKVRTAQEEGLANILKWILSSDQKRLKRKTEVLDVQTAYNRVHSFLARQNSEDILGSIESFTRRYKGALLKNVVNYIDDVEQRIEDAMSPRDKVQSLISSMFGGTKTISLTEKSIEVETREKSKIGLASLSSGEKHVLRILVETLLAKDSTILIDEPEISMHVDWQRELISSMRSVNNSAQLILASHSPEVMADIPDAQIFRI